MLICFLGLIFLVPLTSYASFDTNLKYGSKGEQVKELQQFLTDLGFYTAGLTGNFYSLTLVGVKKFQASHNLPTTGYFGAMSRGVANQILVKRSTQTEIPQIQESQVATNTPTVSEDLTKKVEELTKKVDEQKTVLESIVQNTQPKIASVPTPPIPQTFALASIYQTGQNFPEGGDRFPTVKVTSNKPFAVEKVELYTNDQFEVVFFSVGDGGSYEKIGGPVNGLVSMNFPAKKLYDSALVRISFGGQGIYGGNAKLYIRNQEGSVSSHEVFVTSR
jgi:peptidoglycan hydrolase-like protein with peptidoglycan-binding domain